ncbi:MAG: DNA-directed DNA polymerase I [Candidatus Bathyarchaeia archaeon]
MNPRGAKQTILPNNRGKYNRIGFGVEEARATSEGTPTLPAPQNLPDAYLLSATYDGGRGVVCLKLYEPEAQHVYAWYDNTNHLPYCLTDLPPEELRGIKPLTEHPGLNSFETVVKYDPLNDRKTEMTKIVARDPLSIGGRPSGGIRDLVPRAWEARIRYYESYIYDRQLLMGMPYRIEGGNLVWTDYAPEEEVFKKIEELFGGESPELREYIDRWTGLLQCPVPAYRRAALDIEVYSPVATRVPSPRQANQPIISVSLMDSEGNKRVLILRREGAEEGDEPLPAGVVVDYYDDERGLIREVFKVLVDYPIILTFNGDDFDLRYIYHRAENLGFPRDQIPIILGREFALLKEGIHIDLYKFFFNRSIQVYAFSRRYTEVTLDGVAGSLLGVGKVRLQKPVSQLTYRELARYCLRDAEITFQLSAFDGDLVMRLITFLVRLSRMPMEDVTRQGVSGWIRSLMFFEHRRLGYLIPRSEDLLELKGAVASKAIIKGKKYKGAIVVEPVPGVHFNIAVLDFASLYPSIIKVHNLSYETVLCPHAECQKNKIPGLPHWVCTRNRGLSSLIIGSLRDMRVRWYKTMAKDRSLPEPVRNLYNVVQLTLKVLLNAAYGVMGASAFALYCPPVAEAVTAIGRDVITKTVDKAQSLGIDVVYGDTDSIFLEAPTESQIEELMEWSEEALGLELEIDKFYRYSAFSTLKKNYFGVYPDGSVDIKGLTGKKRHMPRFLKRAFMRMIETLGQVESPEDFIEAKTRIRDIVRSCHDGLKKRGYPLEDLAFNVMIGKSPERYTKTTPQHVKAALLLTEAGYEVRPGDIISFVKVNTELGVKPVRLASVGEVDVSKYMEYVESAFEQVLDALGIDFDEILGRGRFRSLDSFLWGFEQD